MVKDTLNLIGHSRKEIKFCISFIRDTFLIRFTVYKILRVFLENGCRKYARPHVIAFMTKLVSKCNRGVSGMSYIGFSKILTNIFSLVILADSGVIKFLIDWNMFDCDLVLRSCRKLDLQQQDHSRGGSKATGEVRHQEK